jgi:hypothetical protein
MDTFMIVMMMLGDVMVMKGEKVGILVDIVVVVVVWVLRLFQNVRISNLKGFRRFFFGRQSEMVQVFAGECKKTEINDFIKNQDKH